MTQEQIFKLIKIGKFVQESSFASDLIKPKIPPSRAISRVKIEADPQTPTGKAPPTPEPSTPADNLIADPSFDIKQETKLQRRRTHANKSSSVSHVVYQSVTVKTRSITSDL